MMIRVALLHLFAVACSAVEFEGYFCRSASCSWSLYTQDDWGYYSETNSDCKWCTEQCNADANCDAVECGSALGYCSWWKSGTCPLSVATDFSNTCRQDQAPVCCDADGSCTDGDDDYCCRGEFYCSNDGAGYADQRGGIICPDTMPSLCPVADYGQGTGVSGDTMFVRIRSGKLWLLALKDLNLPPASEEPCSNGAGGTFECPDSMSDSQIAQSACESHYGAGHCKTRSCGDFTYWYYSNDLTCNSNYWADEGDWKYEWIFGNTGYTQVGQDAAKGDADVSGNTMFVRTRSSGNWILALGDLGRVLYCSDGAGGTFECSNTMSDSQLAKSACESHHGSGMCTTGSCGSLSYWYDSATVSCNANKPSGKYEWIFGNTGYTTVGQDYDLIFIAPMCPYYEKDFGCFADGAEVDAIRVDSSATSMTMCMSERTNYNYSTSKRTCAKPPSDTLPREGEACEGSCEEELNCVPSFYSPGSYSGFCQKVATNQACFFNCNSADFVCHCEEGEDQNCVCKPDLKLGEACKPSLGFNTWGDDPTGCSTLCYEGKCRNDYLSIGTNVSGLDSRDYQPHHTYCASYFVKDGKCALLPTVADLKLHASCTDNTECNSDGYTACCDGKCKPIFENFHNSLFATIYLGADIDAIRVDSSEMTKYNTNLMNLRTKVSWSQVSNTRPSVNDYPNLAKLWILGMRNFWHGIVRMGNVNHGKKCAKADAIPTFFPLFEDKITYEDEEGNLVAEGADGKIFTVTADGKLVAPIPILRPDGTDTNTGIVTVRPDGTDTNTGIVTAKPEDTTPEPLAAKAYSEDEKQTSWLIIGVISGAVGLMAVGIGVFVWWKKRKRNGGDKEKRGSYDSANSGGLKQQDTHEHRLQSVFSDPNMESNPLHSECEIDGDFLDEDGVRKRSSIVKKNRDKDGISLALIEKEQSEPPWNVKQRAWCNEYEVNVDDEGVTITFRYYLCCMLHVSSNNLIIPKGAINKVHFKRGLDIWLFKCGSLLFSGGAGIIFGTTIEILVHIGIVILLMGVSTVAYAFLKFYYGLEETTIFHRDVGSGSSSTFTLRANAANEANKIIARRFIRGKYDGY